ncbi:MAG: type II secretion system protein E [Parcubacteria group bacterium GW2011_GWA1_40_21]|nr:MAG: type II secretion system protein E [Parcubacteria group bacterium GW2011_GWC1_40_13]KKR53535.1 MAG: type II secretion system protein E [Parcubacteria group bacterium GW2011_GWA1_40_21]
MSILEVLADKNIIRAKDIDKIRGRAESSNRKTEEVLAEMGVKNDEILAAYGDYYKIPTRKLESKDVSFSLLKYIPEESATHYKFVPIGLKDGVLEIGIVDPDDIEARDALNFIASKLNIPFKVFLITKRDFDETIKAYKGLSGEVTKALSELETELSSDLKDIEMRRGDDDISQKNTETKIIEDAPVTKIVATVLRYAIDGRASDVHIEHMRDRVRVRFRVDGILNTSLVLPSSVHQAVVARIKILSNMKLDEKRKPQDGRFTAKISGRKVDFRVSTFPSYYGEKVVMRILDQEKGVQTLETIGLSKKNLELVREALDRPYGLILISGPTGSGKTTTLYSMLNEIDKERYNVLSLEDPIEYNIDGVSQSQVHPDIGYTFATGLKTTLRQDPDVIMVGEIRDKETAQLAVQAALTGHLVFSTIHTNTSTGVIPRLIDMGVDPYLIAPTLILTMSQRLVNLLCPGSGNPLPVEGSIKALIDRQFSDLPEEFKKELPPLNYVYEKSPSPTCPSGIRGRIAVSEAFKMDSDIENLILNNPIESAVFKSLRKKGMITMKEDGIIKALNKIIPFEEVINL